VGRPYRGIGFICRKNKNISYSEVDLHHERLNCVKISNKKNTVFYALGVYMPYNDNSYESFCDYINILDIITAHLENASAPTVIMGDFNVSLPQMKHLSATWYKARPMNKRSLLLYDFICNNNMVVGNFAKKQQINYTYAKGANKSYIDHVLIPSYMLDKLSHCAILQDSDNLSDHFAIQCVMNIDIEPGCSYYEANHLFPRTHWDKHDFCSEYRTNVQNSLGSLCLLNPDSIQDRDQAALCIDDVYSSLISTMHSATKQINSNPSEHRCNNKHWWTTRCTNAKSKNMFWRKLWMENGKPTHGIVYECYKDTKRQFRRACRSAQHESARDKYNIMNCYMRHRNTNKLWAAVKRLKSTNHEIQVPKEELRNYFIRKFNNTDSEQHEISHNMVQEHFAASEVDINFVFSEALVRKYISKLKPNAAAGIDGISPQHFKQALDTDIVLHLSSLLTLCCRHSIVPEAFTQGMIIPIPKQGKDPTEPQGYRPITISVIASKLLEYYILEECSEVDHNPLQFGFIRERGTDIAIALAHDVCQVTAERGSPVHLASLDAEGAFDYLPHDVLFNKAKNVIPLRSWKLMVAWYNRSSARLLIGRHLDKTEIPIKRGVRQGALTSPLLFNVFYRELIDTLSRHDAGVVVGKHKYNVFNYADDVLLASTTVGGLQSLIDSAAEMVSNDGLSFNPAKTVCTTFGRNIYKSDPSWHLNGAKLQNEENIKYLGAIIGTKGSQRHAQERISAAHRSFYALQSVGLHKDGVSPQTSGYIHKSVISPCLTYGCNAIYMNKRELHDINSCQGKLIKANLGLYYSSRTTPLLQALNITSVADIIDKETISLFRRCFISDSAARTFYSDMLLSPRQYTPKTLTDRVKIACNKLKIDNIQQLLLNNVNVFKSQRVTSGLVDSIVYCLNDFNTSNRILLQQLVNAF